MGRGYLILQTNFTNNAWRTNTNDHPQSHPLAHRRAHINVFSNSLFDSNELRHIIIRIQT